MFTSIERWIFKQGLLHPWLFRSLLRPIAYVRSDGDPERVHELAMEALEAHSDLLDGLSAWFQSPRLRVHLKQIATMPFGTAAGLDKNGHALLPMSKIFGFLEPGTVVMEPREGNPRPRVHVDLPSRNIYNAQGFPSEGFEVFLSNLRDYRDNGGSTPVFASICGLPHDEHDLEGALDQIASMTRRLISMADGFVWNPFSPNTQSLKALRTPANFRKTAEIVRERGHASHIRLVKLGPCEPDQESQWLDLLAGWIEGGGDGAVVVNTFMTPKERIPAESWGYPSAGISGQFLAEYRQRAIRLIRAHFPGSMIIATGGIGSGEAAWQAFEAGANAIEGYTPFTFNGFGLIRSYIRFIERALDRERVSTLQEYIETR